jgi:drug/metabolite transporter (DMT)-like permease
MNAVALGLGAALCWGIADALARVATRRVGAYRSLLYAQLVGLAALTVYGTAVGAIGPALAAATPAAWGWALATGAVFTGASFAFYRALEIGVLALVSPITASYAAVTVLLALASGETLTAPRALGLAAALGGVVLASTGHGGAPAASGRPAPGSRVAPGAKWALAAALAFGVTFWLLGFRVTPAFGGVASVWVLRLTSVAVLAAAARPARAARASLALPAGGWALLGGVGVLDTLAFVANNVGTTRGLVSVVSVLGSLFSAVTVLIGWMVFHERLGRVQWIGVACLLVGVVLVSR